MCSVVAALSGRLKLIYYLLTKNSYTQNEHLLYNEYQIGGAICDQRSHPGNKSKLSSESYATFLITSINRENILS